MCFVHWSYEDTVPVCASVCHSVASVGCTTKALTERRRGANLRRSVIRCLLYDVCLYLLTAEHPRMITSHLQGRTFYVRSVPLRWRRGRCTLQPAHLTNRPPGVTRYNTPSTLSDTPTRAGPGQVGSDSPVLKIGRGPGLGPWGPAARGKRAPMCGLA
jgi:hypothetical protein